MTDETHAVGRRSWVESANGGSDFPIQNLPWGVFRRAGSDEAPRIGVAIGDQILDVHGAVAGGLLPGLKPETACALSAPRLNDLMGRGRAAWAEARAAVGDLLDAETVRLRDDDAQRAALLVPQDDAEMFVPATIGDYTDFYCSIHHATNVGSMFRPDNPLMPNYKHLPVGYHGRASSIVVSGTPIARPMGQTIGADADRPTYGPSRLLDYELEMGCFVGPGNALGTPVTMGGVGEQMFGLCVVNDWSARDVQKWEYQPLGPFNAKNFCTTISPWVVTLDALAPYRTSAPPRGADDPPVLDYLRSNEDDAFDVTVEVWLTSAKMREAGTAPMRVSRGSLRDLYWTLAQMLVHHTSTGCNLRPGDLIATGTISGPTEDARGCLLERTWRGQNPITLPDGTERKFLQDGDAVEIRAFCARDGAARIGFGRCVGTVVG